MKNKSLLITFVYILGFFAGNAQDSTYTYTGNDQVYVVPDSVYGLEIKLWGAGGAKGFPYMGRLTSPGGPGGFTTGFIAVIPGETLTVMVGQGGAFSELFKTSSYGGGGDGFGQGGGRSAIRRDTLELITAGGGGGGSSDISWDALSGGAGGGLEGTGSNNAQSGRGGTQTAGGVGSMYNSATSGIKFKGGAGADTNGAFGSSGGGGYFGGGGANVGVGGGGSGFLGDAVDGITIAGQNGQVPASDDPDYLIGSAVGGVTGEGGNGLVVIRPACRFTPVVTASADTFVCAGDSVLLSATASGPGNYVWETVEGNPVRNGQQVFVQPEDSAVYVVRFIVSGACETRDTVLVEVIPTPAKPEISLNGNVLSCAAGSGTYTWFRNGNLLEGEETHIIENITPGTYRVEYTEGFCTVASDPFVFDNTGFQFVDRTANIYPNPSNGNVLIKNAASFEIYQLFDISGKCVQKGLMLGEEQMLLNIEELRAGIYILLLEGKSQPVRLPLVRQ